MAGYITKFIKNELRNEEAKTRAVESEEEISEEAAPTQTEPKNEPVVEESPTEKADEEPKVDVPSEQVQS